MNLVYIYNSFIFDFVLTFLPLLTFICVFIRFEIVLGHFLEGSRSCICQERLPWHAEESNEAKQSIWRIFTTWFGTYCIYVLPFRFDVSPNNLFVSCHYQVLLVCLAVILFKINTSNIQYFSVLLEIQIKYIWKSIISLLKNCTLQKAYFALQYWEPYF